VGDAGGEGCERSQALRSQTLAFRVSAFRAVVQRYDDAVRLFRRIEQRGGAAFDR
jgi:hypothetical protein